MPGALANLSHLIQYQRLVQQVDLAVLSGKFSQMNGQRVSNIRGRSMEFDEFRTYQPGDDIRSIDWRVSARTGKTHVRIYKEERERPLYLITDLGKTMQFGSQYNFKAVTAIEATAILAWKSLLVGDRVGGISVSNIGHTQSARPHKPQLGVKRLLFFLKNMTAQQEAAVENISQFSNNDSYLEETLTQSYRLCKPGSLLCLISDLSSLTETSWRHLSLLKRHCSVIVFFIYDPMEFELPALQDLPVTDGAHIDTLYMGSTFFRELFAKQQTAKYNNFKLLFHKLKIPLYSISSEFNTFSQLACLNTGSRSPQNIHCQAFSTAEELL